MARLRQGYGAANEWAVKSGPKNKQQVPHRHPASFSGHTACRGDAGWVGMTTERAVASSPSTALVKNLLLANMKQKEAD